jgi:xeroderma pigmentosum group C-complementing protein
MSERISLIQDDSEDEFDWEEVDVPEHEPQHLEITLQLNPKSTKAAASNKLVVDSRG